MLLDVEWSRVQGERAAECGNTISWESPLQELAHRETYYLDEKDTDKDVGNLMNGKYDNQVGIDKNHVHRSEITVLKAGTTMASNRPMTHLREMM